MELAILIYLVTGAFFVGACSALMFARPQDFTRVGIPRRITGLAVMQFMWPIMLLIFIGVIIISRRSHEVHSVHLP